MIHHASFGTNDLERSRRFYDPVMKILGLSLMRTDGLSLDYGSGNLIFSLETPVNGEGATPGNGVHIAFGVETRKMVDEFYRVALQSGGRDAGPPGLRPNYDPNYYGAFVFDPDGNKLEAVTFSGA